MRGLLLVNWYSLDLILSVLTYITSSPIVELVFSVDYYVTVIKKNIGVLWMLKELNSLFCSVELEGVNLDPTLYKFMSSNVVIYKFDVHVYNNLT